MKFLNKKIYIILFFLFIFEGQNSAHARDSKVLYTRENISNYFQGVVYSKNNYHSEAFQRLKKVQLLKKKHSKFNIEYLRTLIILEKFNDAFTFSKSVWSEDELFFEADLVLGLNFFIKKDYNKAEKYFTRLNNISRYNLFFDDFVGNILLAWIKASQYQSEESFKFLDRIPSNYVHLKKTQRSFLYCYFDMKNTETSYRKIIQDQDYNFSRYNFFLANYLLYKNNIKDAKEVIKKSRKKYNSNLLIRQAENFLINNQIKKVKKFFNCKNPEDALSEFFYVIANLYSSEKDYQLSNFYLKISQYLNKNFLPNRALLAENFYFQEKYKLSKNVYSSLKKIGPVYSWYASKSISTILLKEKDTAYSVENLKKEFNKIENPNYEHFYDLANFYKDNKYYEESIKYYSEALGMIEKNHFLVPKILDRRGTSYERLGNWEKAEKDLLESLKILPDQAHVLNYLAYSWVDQGINLNRGLEMLKKANNIRKQDGYIIDSLGWAYYAIKNYSEAEKFLRRAVELLPFDPIINDHYADTLWMLNKHIQARYIWSYILELEDTEEELKKSINNKLIFGITKKL